MATGQVALQRRHTTVSTLQITSHLTVDARTHLTTYGVVVYTERAPRVKHSNWCDLPSAVSGHFTGTCTLHARTTGYVAKGTLTTFPDFWFTSIHGTWDDPGSTSDNNSGNFDTSWPAVAGTYNTQRYLMAYGLLKANARPPTGVTIRIKVTRRS